MTDSLREWAEDQLEQIARAEANPECEQCGCIGNMSCGHEPLGKDCSLDLRGICPCCNINPKHMEKLAEFRQEELFDR